jgi:hypothetical protein
VDNKKRIGNELHNAWGRDCKICNVFPNKLDYDERMEMQRMLKQVTSATMEGTREEESKRKAEG